MKIIHKDQAIWFDNWDKEEIKKKLSAFLKPVGQECFSYEAYKNIIVKHEGNIHWLRAENIFFPNPCPVCNGNECMDCEEINDKKIELGKKCLFSDCFNSDHALYYSYNQFMSDYRNNLPIEEISKKYGLPLLLAKKTLKEYIEEEEELANLNCL